MSDQGILLKLSGTNAGLVQAAGLAMSGARDCDSCSMRRLRAATLRNTEPDSASFWLLHLLSRFFGRDAPNEPQKAMFRLEMTQLASTSKAAQAAVPEPGGTAPPAAQRRLVEAILDERKGSTAFCGGFKRRPG